MKNNEATYVCPLCGSGATSLFAEVGDYAVSNESYKLIKCDTCGIIHTVDAPVGDMKEDYRTLEQELYRADHPQRLFDRIYYNMRFITIRRRIRLIENLTRLKKGKLLNYGAKSGFFSSRMSDRGWKVTSLEEYHEHRIFSLEMFHHRMMELSEIDSLPAESYDVITLWHFFEHHKNPEQLIDKLRALLKPNGLLLIACPNTDSYDAAYYGQYWAAWDVPRHLWHFNPSSMLKLGLRHNLILMYHKRIPFDVFYISLLSEQYRNKRYKTLRGLAMGVYFWYKSNWRRGKSSSIVYVFRKNNTKQ